MATKSSKTKKRLNAPKLFQDMPGQPVYDEYGRIVGFTGQEMLDEPIDVTRAQIESLMRQREQLVPPLQQIDTNRSNNEANRRALYQMSPDDIQNMYQRMLNEQSPTDMRNDNYQPTAYQPTGNTSWDNFVQRATAIAQQNGFPPEVLLSQAALETGRNPRNAPGNNWFGIKGKGSAGSNVLGTSEYGQGGYYKTQSGFRAYNSPDESIQDYINLIKFSPRYKAAWENRNDPVRMIQEIKKGGYATDPKYVDKILQMPEFRTSYQNMPQQVSYQPPVRPSLEQKPMSIGRGNSYILASNQPKAQSQSSQPQAIKRSASSLQSTQDLLNKQIGATSPPPAPIKEQVPQSSPWQSIQNALQDAGRNISGFFGNLFNR